MPNYVKGRKVKKAVRKKASAGAKKRRRGLRAVNLNYHQWIRFFSAASVLLMAAFTLAAIMAFNHYRTYPGNIERDSISSPGRGSDFIIVSWDEAHSTDVYKVWCKERDLVLEDRAKAQEKAAKEEGSEAEAPIVPDDTWTLIETDVPEATFEDLKENTSYSFIIRADNKKKEGEPTAIRNFKTKKTQKISVNKKITKFSFSEPFKINAMAETDLEYESSDTGVADVDPETNKIVIKGSGDTEIT